MSRPRPAGRRRNAFITGASAGLGLAFARALLADGFAVWGSSREAARLSPLSWHTDFHAVELDLCSPVAACAAFARAEAEADGFDLVVQNAGFGLFGRFSEVDEAVWEEQVGSMLLGTARLSRAAFRGMLARRRGCLVHVSSLAVEFPLPFMSGYNVAKAGLAALSESLMAEARGTEVSVIDFRPGDYRTGFNTAMRGRLEPRADATERGVWERLDATLAAAPSPERAARDLLRVAARGRSGIVRSGSFFQARLAPAFAALVPASWRRAAEARYFHLG